MSLYWRLTVFMGQMDLDLSSHITSEINPAVTDLGNIPGAEASGGQPVNDTSNVPEPSVLVLLAVGLPGIGATRYRRQPA